MRGRSRLDPGPARTPAWLRTVGGGAAGLVAGLLAGVGLLAAAGIAVAHGVATPDQDPGQLIEATHVPSLLTSPGEAGSLRYDIYCAAPGTDPESGAPCDAGGTAYVRAGQTGPFRAIPLRLDPAAVEGRYVADLPADVGDSPSGFSYYAVLRNNASGASTTLPAGGAAAPQRSLRLDRAVKVELGKHVFGAVARAQARVAEASWGRGPDQAGIEEGPQLVPIGASSFDVDPAGNVTVLDEANRRLLRFPPGGGKPTATPADVRGTIADLALDSDGGAYVLETVGDGGQTPLVRSFDAGGRSRGAWHLAQRSASSVRIGPGGPEALEYPAAEWMPVVEHGAGLGADRQVQRGRPGRGLRGGGEIVVQREAEEARIALVGANGVRRSWRIQSSTPIAEVQLAEPLGNKLAVVLRVYSDERDEFVALVLDDEGVARQLSLAPADWAETAPLARFRLAGRSLYQLGSTPAGTFVDRFDLEVG